MPPLVKDEHPAVETRHQQHLYFWSFDGKFSSQINAGHPRHFEVGQEKMDIRFVGFRLLESILAVSGS